MTIAGKGTDGLKHEAGGYRIQRVPPTERRGRVHTSTVTVAVLSDGQAAPAAEFDDSEFDVEWYSGSRAGGQHRNRHQNCCRVTHRPTGLIESRQGRVRWQNLTSARNALRARLRDAETAKVAAAESLTRSKQVGSGMRGDKTVTISLPG